MLEPLIQLSYDTEYFLNLMCFPYAFSTTAVSSKVRHKTECEQGSLCFFIKCFFSLMYRSDLSAESLITGATVSVCKAALTEVWVSLSVSPVTVFSLSKHTDAR